MVSMMDQGSISVKVSGPTVVGYGVNIKASGKTRL